MASDGGIFNYGTAFFGSQGGKHLNAPVAGIGDPATGGYREVAADGGVLRLQRARAQGCGGQPLNAPIVGMAFDQGRRGYWLVVKDGGIFTYGDAALAGSMGGSTCNSPVVVDRSRLGHGRLLGGWPATAASSTSTHPSWAVAGPALLTLPSWGSQLGLQRRGLLPVAKDGGIFNYGTPFLGSRGGQPLNAPVVGVAADIASGGYWEIASDGGIFNYGAPFLGSRGGQPLNAPVVGIGAG